MGNICCPKRKERRKIVLLLLGLDNAGKTVTVKHLAGEDAEAVVPTVGFSVVELHYSQYDVSVFDLGGRPDFRDVWSRYYVDAYGLIFVIDAGDFDRITEAQSVLNNIVSHEKIKGKPVLVLANKQDSENALDEIDLIEKLELETLANENECPTLIQSCCANNSRKLDPGLKTGYNWLINSIISEYKQLHERVQDDVEEQLRLDEHERRDKLLRIQYRNEQDALKSNTVISLHTNGTVERDVFVVKQSNNSTEVRNFSDDDEDEENEKEDDVRSARVLIEDGSPQRPQSATQLIRQQLQLDNVKRRSSLHFGGSNKTAPASLFNTRMKAPKSATVRRVSDNLEEDRRNLRSAGDSVFIVADSNQKKMPNSDGSGDLSSVFGPSTRNTPPSRLGRSLKEVLPPINDTIHMNRMANGNYF